VEESAASQASVIAMVPLMLLIMLTVLMFELKTFQRLIVVVSVAPLGLIGVVAALLLSGRPLGFVDAMQEVRAHANLGCALEVGCAERVEPDGEAARRRVGERRQDIDRHRQRHPRAAADPEHRIAYSRAGGHAATTAPKPTRLATRRSSRRRR
jgi:hypothetical protein